MEGDLGDRLSTLVQAVCRCLLVLNMILGFTALGLWLIRMIVTNYALL